MLGEILDFSAGVLVDRGRLCMWMPVAGEADESGREREVDGGAEEYAIPRHPALELVSECTQHFNKWSRRLLTYRRLRDDQVDADELLGYTTSRLALREEVNGMMNGTADDLNAFRRRVNFLLLCLSLHRRLTAQQYFQGFKEAPSR
jgi:tRNA (guanine10-N2)-methyltransferase